MVKGPGTENIRIDNTNYVRRSTRRAAGLAQMRMNSGKNPELDAREQALEDNIRDWEKIPGPGLGETMDDIHGRWQRVDGPAPEEPSLNSKPYPEGGMSRGFPDPESMAMQKATKGITAEEATEVAAGGGSLYLLMQYMFPRLAPLLVGGGALIGVFGVLNRWQDGQAELDAWRELQEQQWAYWERTYQCSRFEYFAATFLEANYFWSNSEGPWQDWHVAERLLAAAPPPDYIDPRLLDRIEKKLKLWMFVFPVFVVFIMFIRRRRKRRSK